MPGTRTETSAQCVWSYPTVPVATMAIDGARNAGLLAARILSLGDDGLAARLEEHRLALEQRALRADAAVRSAPVRGTD